MDVALDNKNACQNMEAKHDAVCYSYVVVFLVSCTCWHGLCLFVSDVEIWWMWWIESMLVITMVLDMMDMVEGRIWERPMVNWICYFLGDCARTTKCDRVLRVLCLVDGAICIFSLPRLQCIGERDVTWKINFYTLRLFGHMWCLWCKGLSIVRVKLQPHLSHELTSLALLGSLNSKSFMCKVAFLHDKAFTRLRLEHEGGITWGQWQKRLIFENFS